MYCLGLKSGRRTRQNKSKYCIAPDFSPGRGREQKHNNRALAQNIIFKMGYLKIWIHLVWTTKNREPVLTRETRIDIFSHIKENAEKKGIYVDFINGYLEHVHCLISLAPGQNIDKIMMLLKGESSYWINKNKIFPGKFKWQDEYYAASVSESAVDRVREYIKNQEEHHRKKSFHQEYDKLMLKNGFDKFVSG